MSKPPSGCWRFVSFKHSWYLLSLQWLRRYGLCVWWALFWCGGSISAPAIHIIYPKSLGWLDGSPTSLSLPRPCPQESPPNSSPFLELPSPFQTPNLWESPPKARPSLELLKTTLTGYLRPGSHICHVSLSLPAFPSITQDCFALLIKPGFINSAWLAYYIGSGGTQQPGGLKLIRHVDTLKSRHDLLILHSLQVYPTPEYHRLLGLWPRRVPYVKATIPFTQKAAPHPIRLCFWVVNLKINLLKISIW